jgi:hypothetical protein
LKDAFRKSMNVDLVDRGEKRIAKIPGLDRIGKDPFLGWSEKFLRQC